MDVIYYLFIGAVGVAAALASLAIWAPRITRVRVAALALAALFMPVAYAQMVELLSKPKPMSFEWYERAASDAVVLGINLDEGRAIYLWLRLAGNDQPRYYVVPWNIKLAEKLEDAADDAVRRNSTIILRNPFQKLSEEEMGDLNVEIMPPPLPPQKRPRFPPRIINPREFKI